MFDQFGQPMEPKTRKVVAFDRWGEPLYEGDTAIYLEDADCYVHTLDLENYLDELRDVLREEFLKKTVYFTKYGR